MTFDDDLDRAFRTLGDRLHESIRRELAASAAVIAAHVEARTPEPPPRDTQSHALRDRVLDLDQAPTLTATLDTLARAAAASAARAAVFLVRSRYEAWRLVGFEPFPDATRAHLEPERAGIVAEALRRRQAVRTTDSTGLPHFAGRTPRAVAVPLLIGGEPVAVLYADAGLVSGGGFVDFDDAAIEILCSHAAKTLEAHIALMAACHVLNRSTSRQSSTEVQAP